MASIFSWLRRVWSGSRDEPCRDYPATYASSQPFHTKGVTATTAELSGAGVSYPDLNSFALQGIFNLHLNSANNTFTSYPNIGLDPVSGSTPGHGAIVGIRLNTADNTWTSDRPIYFDPINEGTPELGVGPTRTSSVAATSSPSTVERQDHVSLRGSVLGSTNSVAIGPGAGRFARHRGQRSVSAVSRTDGGDSTRRAHDRPATSTQTLSPAPSNVTSPSGLSERELFNPDRSERSAPTATRTERADSPRTHGRSPSSTDLLSPAAGLQPTGALNPLNPYQSIRFDTTFSPPTPPESSAVLYNSPSIKREVSPSMSPSGPSRQVIRQSEMEQIAPTRAQPAAVIEPFQTPSKPTRHSTNFSHASVGGLSTPPMTDSAKRPAPFIFHGAQVGGGSQCAFPPSPTSPTPSHRTLNPPVTIARPLAATNPVSPTAITQPIITSTASPQVPAIPTMVDPTARRPIRTSETMEFTSLREIYAQPLVNGYRVLPTRGPECLACHQRMTLQAPTRGGPNDGRRYYFCVAGGHGWNFGTFADVEGQDDSRTCDCGEPSRRTETRKGGQFWKCMEMNCTWKTFF